MRYGWTLRVLAACNCLISAHGPGQLLSRPNAVSLHDPSDAIAPQPHQMTGTTPRTTTSKAKPSTSTTPSNAAGRVGASTLVASLPYSSFLAFSPSKGFFYYDDRSNGVIFSPRCLSLVDEKNSLWYVVGLLFFLCYSSSCSFTSVLH